MSGSPPPPLFDAHNHLHDAWLAPHRDRVLADLAAAGVRAGVVNGTCESDWPDVAALCRSTPSFPLSALSPGLSALSSRLPALLPSVGLHPWDAGNRSPDWQKNLLSALTPSLSSASPPDTAAAISAPRSSKPDLRAPTSSTAPFVGEIGLDRWILDRARPDDPRLAGLRRAPLDEQREVFLWQLDLAAARNLPATIHCIDAYGPLHDALRTARLPARGFLLHAYAGSLELMKAFADLGAFFSFNGYFLDPRRARRLRELYAAIPLDRLLVETDAPAMPLPADRARFTLPPTPAGDTINHPANLTATYAGLAEWRGTPFDELAALVANNFARFFTV